MNELLQTITLIIGWLGVYLYIKRNKYAPHLNLLNAILSLVVYQVNEIYGMLVLLPFIFVNIWLITTKYETKKHYQNVKIKNILIGLIVGVITYIINTSTESGSALTILTTIISSIALFSQIDNYKHTQKLWLLASVLYMVHAYVNGLPITSVENAGYVVLSIYGVYQEFTKSTN